MYTIVKRSENVDVGTCLIQYCIDDKVLNIKVFGTVKDAEVYASKEYLYVEHATSIAEGIINKWFEKGYIRENNIFIPTHQISLIEITNVEKHFINPTNV